MILSEKSATFRDHALATPGSRFPQWPAAVLGQRPPACPKPPFDAAAHPWRRRRHGGADTSQVSVSTSHHRIIKLLAQNVAMCLTLQLKAADELPNKMPATCRIGSMCGGFRTRLRCCDW